MVAINRIRRLGKTAEVEVEAAVLRLTVQVIHGLEVIYDVRTSVRLVSS